MNRIEWIEKYMTTAEQLIYDNQVEQGLQVLDNLLYEEPGYGSLHNHIGWAYMYYTQDHTKAELHLKLAIRFDEYAPAYLHLGTLYNRLGRYSEAIECMKVGVTKPNANKYVLMLNIAQAYELRGDLRAAIKAYKEAMVTSVAGHEVNQLIECVKRCRRKRMAMLFTF
jgi:tetratricopeptide (TPR) repeat protein